MSISRIPSAVVVPSEEVGDSLADGRPVVALESTVYSNLGLPSPDNVTALDRCIEAIRSAGAVPAVTAVLDGVLRAGLNDHEYERILGQATKAAERDLAVAIGQRWDVGATTVSASLAIAEAAGITVFATGGIGGVHRGSEVTGDVSADLGAIARHRVATVSAGAKSFLDLPKTLEALETLGATVVGWQTDVLPAFTARATPYSVPYRIDDLTELAAIVAAQTGFGRGILVANPVPESDALDQQVHDDALDSALRDAETSGISGAKVTPFVLARIAEATDGASIPANIALVANNAKLAAEIAAALRPA
jgi:pseudouridine-5'-phosphate glycosidase